MNKFAIKGTQKKGTTVVIKNCKNCSLRRNFQAKPNETKQFLKIFRQVYEKHVRSHRRNLFPMQQINTTSIDITSYIPAKRLRTPNVVQVRISRQESDMKQPSKILERLSLRPLSIFKQYKETNEFQQKALCTRRSECKIEKRSKQKLLIQRLPTQLSKSPKQKQKIQCQLRKRVKERRSQNGFEFGRWETQSDCSQKQTQFGQS